LSAASIFLDMTLILAHEGKQTARPIFGRIT